MKIKKLLVLEAFLSFLTKKKRVLFRELCRAVGDFGVFGHFGSFLTQILAIFGPRAQIFNFEVPKKALKSKNQKSLDSSQDTNPCEALYQLL